MCSACGNAGHIARDCQQRRPGTGFGPGGEHNKTKMDDEVGIHTCRAIHAGSLAVAPVSTPKSKLFQYLSLMAELGEGPPPAPKTDNKPHSGGGGRGGFGNARGAQMFNQARPPAALMGPRGGGAPPPPPGESYESGYGGGGWGSGKPPSLMQQNVPPPSWSGRGGSGGGSWNQPPPPPGTTGPPARGSAPPPPPGEWERAFHFSNL